ncbi:DMT family transporter [Bacillus timonensis]|nr:DMT family transporter [Bacillus timonensis]
MTAERFYTSKLGIIIAAIGATFLWGSAFPFIKLSYTELGIAQHEFDKQILFAGYRFFLAAILIMLFFMLINKKMIYKKGTGLPLLKVGVFQTFLQYVLFYIGLSYSTGIQGAIIAGTASFFQILFAHFMYKDDYINQKKILGLIIGFTGVIIVNLTRGSFTLDFGIGEFLLLIAMMVSAFGNLLARNASAKMEVSYLTSYQMLFGSIGLLLSGGVLVGFFPFDFSVKAMLMLLYLAFLSAAGFILWNNVMKYNQVGKVSMYLFLVPVFGVFLSGMLLREPIHLFVLLGLLLVTAGIVVVNRREVKKESPV